MEISIRPEIRKNLDFIGITKEEVEDTVNNSDNKKVIPSLDKNKILFLRKVKNGTYILIDAFWQKSKVEVRNAFRIFNNFIEEAQSNDPFVLLQALANKFGLYVRVGDQQNKYIYEETISVDPTTKKYNLIKIIDIPPKHTAMSQLEFSHMKFGNEKLVVVRLAYAIDREKYADYVKERMAEMRDNHS